MKTQKEKMRNFFQTHIKKHIDCPACKGANSMLADNKNKIWQCKDCGYSITYEKLQNNYIYWFCDDCKTYLNIQPGFETASEMWICQECGFENDISTENICGQCKDCGNPISGADKKLCDDCLEKHKNKKAANLEKAKAFAAKLGRSLLATALKIINNAIIKAVQTYKQNLKEGEAFNKEACISAVVVAANSVIFQMKDEVQGVVISTFGNVQDWITQKTTEAIELLESKNNPQEIDSAAMLAELAEGVVV